MSKHALADSPLSKQVIFSCVFFQDRLGVTFSIQGSDVIVLEVDGTVEDVIIEPRVLHGFKKYSHDDRSRDALGPLSVPSDQKVVGSQTDHEFSCEVSQTPSQPTCDRSLEERMVEGSDMLYEKALGLAKADCPAEGIAPNTTAGVMSPYDAIGEEDMHHSNPLANVPPASVATKKGGEDDPQQRSYSNPREEVESAGELSGTGNSETVKVLVECDAIFGMQVKKLFKYKPSFGGAAVGRDIHHSLRAFIDSLIAAFPGFSSHIPAAADSDSAALVLCTAENVQISYLDSDMGEYVALDENSWGEFSQQQRKHIRVHLTHDSAISGGSISITAKVGGFGESNEAMADLNLNRDISKESRECIEDEVDGTSRRAPAAAVADAVIPVELTDAPAEESEGEGKGELLCRKQSAAISDSSASHIRRFHYSPLRCNHRNWFRPGSARSSHGLSHQAARNAHYRPFDCLPEIGSILVSVNGVQLKGLSKAFKAALITQRRRPIAFEFRAAVDLDIEHSQDALLLAHASGAAAAAALAATRADFFDEDDDSDGDRASDADRVYGSSSTVGGLRSVSTDITATTGVGRLYSSTGSVGPSRSVNTNSGYSPSQQPSLRSVSTAKSASGIRRNHSAASGVHSVRAAVHVAHSVKPVLVNSSSEKRPEDINGFPYSLFISKYAHSLATKLRKQTDSILQDYINCDWAAAKRDGTGLPQRTLVSVYLYIESELLKLGLLDHRKPQGEGVPVLSQSNAESEEEAHLWADLRNHIEYFIFMRVSSSTRALWPVFRPERETLPQYASRNNSHTHSPRGSYRAAGSGGGGILSSVSGDDCEDDQPLCKQKQDAIGRQDQGGVEEREEMRSVDRLNSELLEMDDSLHAMHLKELLSPAATAAPATGTGTASSIASSPSSPFSAPRGGVRGGRMSEEDFEYDQEEDESIAMVLSSFVDALEPAAATVSITREAQQHDQQLYVQNPTSQLTVQLPTYPSLNNKLAFLRFVTLEDLGLKFSDSKSSPSASVYRHRHRNRYGMQGKGHPLRTNAALLGREEWYVAVRSLSAAMERDTPGEILLGLVEAAKLITHALHALLRMDRASSQQAVTRGERSSRLSVDDSLPRCSSMIACGCGLVHVARASAASPRNRRADHHQPMTCFDNYAVYSGRGGLVSTKVMTDAALGTREGREDSSGGAVGENVDDEAAAIVATRVACKELQLPARQLLCGVLRSAYQRGGVDPSLNDDRAKGENTVGTQMEEWKEQGQGQEREQEQEQKAKVFSPEPASDSGGDLSADDIVPAITWAVIQANPQNIECVLWICSEFRHPAMVRQGEQAYCLAQLSSAVEFCRNAAHHSFEYTPRQFQQSIQLYICSLKLFISCKEGNLSAVEDLVLRKHADVNAQSPDCKDTPLTASIRFRQLHVAMFLLKQPGIVIDKAVNLFRGSHQRSTALMIAAQGGMLSLVVTLLRSGADRYYTDDDGKSALDYAREIRHTALETVLMADPATLGVGVAAEVDLIDFIDEGNAAMVSGFLQQGVPVNYLREPDFVRSPLIAAVEREDAGMVRMLLSSKPVLVEVDFCSVRSGESALAVAVKICVRNAARIDSDARDSGLVDTGVKERVGAGHDGSANESGALAVIAAMLLRAGANRYLSDDQGLTPVQSIVQQERAREQLRKHKEEGAGELVPLKEDRHSGEAVLSPLTSSPLATGVASTSSFDSDAERLTSRGGGLIPVAVSVSVYESAAAAAAVESVSPVVNSAADSGDNREISGLCWGEVLPTAAAQSSSPTGIRNTSGLPASELPLPFHTHPHTHRHTHTPVSGARRTAFSEEAESQFLKLRDILVCDPATTRPIYELARFREYTQVEALLYQGVCVNQISPRNRYTALIAAIYNSDMRMLDLLLRAHEIYQRTYCGRPPQTSSAMYATSGRNSGGSVEGAGEVNTGRSASNSTADNTGIAARGISGNNRIANGLADNYNKLDLDIAGKGNMTALHYAAQKGDAKLVGRLLQAGASRDLRNCNNHTPFDVAITNGHTEAANVLKFDPAKISICLAAKHGDWVVMRALMHQGVSINTQREHAHGGGNNSRGTSGDSVNRGDGGGGGGGSASFGINHSLHTPLIAACAHKQTETVKLILSMKETDVNIANLLGQTALMYAAACGDETTVLRLLHAGADRQALDLSSSDASAVASSKGHTSIAILLRHDPCRVFVHDVIRHNDFAAVVSMFKQGVDPNQVRFSRDSPQEAFERRGGCLTSAQGEGENLRVLSLHSNSSAADIAAAGVGAAVGVSPGSIASPRDAQSTTHTVSTASYSSRLESSSSVTAGGTASSTRSLLASQHFFGNDERNQYIIDGETPLIVAARHNRSDVVKLLLRAPEIHVNACDCQGRTALHHAAVMGHEAIVLVLLKAGCSRYLKDRTNLNPARAALLVGKDSIAAIIEADPYVVHIHDACEQGRMLIVTALLKQGCPPTYRDEREGKLMQTPLMAAASGGATDIVRMLLRIESVVQIKDAVDLHGRTALMRAAAVGALDITAVLLNVGCDRTLRDHDGLSARDHASRHSFSVMIQFISQNMVR